MKRILAILLCVIPIASVKADIITYPLTELEGPVGRHPNWDIVSFDLGVTFTDIQSVKIQCSGTISPGLGIQDGLFYYDIPGIIQTFIDYPALGSCLTNIGPYDGSFSVEQVLECTYSANWDILLDGQEELITHITSNLIVLGGSTLQSPTATISQAALIVQGDVFVQPCDYILLGDLDDNCWTDLVDFSLLASQWQDPYDANMLADLAENWLIDCQLNPEYPECVPK